MDSFVITVLTRRECNKHGMPHGIPCYHFHTESGILPGICDQRARAAGMTGRVNAKSLSTGRTVPRRG